MHIIVKNNPPVTMIFYFNLVGNVCVIMLLLYFIHLLYKNIMSKWKKY